MFGQLDKFLLVLNKTLVFQVCRLILKTKNIRVRVNYFYNKTSEKKIFVYHCLIESSATIVV